MTRLLSWLDRRRVKVGALVAFYALVGFMVVLTDEPRFVFAFLTFVVTALAWSFTLLFGIRSPWRRSVVGRSLMYVWVALTAVLTLIFFSYFLGAYPGRDYVRALLYSSLIPAFGSFIKVLVEQQAGRDRGDVPPKVDTDL